MSIGDNDKWPDVIEIEVNSRCNRRCPYCPNSLSGTPRNDRLMEKALFERIVTEIASIGFSGRLSFHFFNEPLIRKDLEVLVAWARPRLPWAYFVLYSNGDLLDEKRHINLLDAGIDKFRITRHSWDTYPQRPFQHVQYPSAFSLSNRGGTVFRNTESLNLPCFGPAEMMIVTVNGDVVLCHEDAYRQNVMGNLERQSLPDVWFSESFQSVRERLKRGHRKAGANICAVCNNRHYPLPGASI